MQYHYDVVIIAENEEESQALDLLGKLVDPDGLIASGTYEVRLSDDVSGHYVLLKGPTREA